MMQVKQVAGALGALISGVDLRDAAVLAVPRAGDALVEDRLGGVEAVAAVTAERDGGGEER